MPKNRKNLTLNSPVASVLSQPRVANYPERGARLARREERAYREYVSDEQRSQAGCPARRIVKYWLGQDTRPLPAVRAGIVVLALGAIVAARPAGGASDNGTGLRLP